MNDSHTVETLAGLAGTLLDDLNQVLLTDELFLLGHWIESAKTLGETHDEQALLEYNAKIQVKYAFFSLFSFQKLAACFFLDYPVGSERRTPGLCSQTLEWTRL